jgi:hypothetical protein
MLAYSKIRDSVKPITTIVIMISGRTMERMSFQRMENCSLMTDSGTVEGGGIRARYFTITGVC